MIIALLFGAVAGILLAVLGPGPTLGGITIAVIALCYTAIRLGEHL